MEQESVVAIDLVTPQESEAEILGYRVRCSDTRRRHVRSQLYARGLRAARDPLERGSGLLTGGSRQKAIVETRADRLSLKRRDKDSTSKNPLYATVGA